jgi:hypothetical protein
MMPINTRSFRKGDRKRINASTRMRIVNNGEVIYPPEYLKYLDELSEQALKESREGKLKVFHSAEELIEDLRN